jgi:hypothetical protein
MESFLLSVHVLAAILLVGPVAVTTSAFPRYAPRTLASVGAADCGAADSGDPGTARMLLRITRGYGRLALVVPVVGLLLATVQGRTTEIWILVAMVLTAAAGALLVLQIVPRQEQALGAPDDGTQLRRLGTLAGVFNVLWAAVVVLMIVRPGADRP